MHTYTHAQNSSENQPTAFYLAALFRLLPSTFSLLSVPLGHQCPSVILTKSCVDTASCLCPLDYPSFLEMPSSPGLRAPFTSGFSHSFWPLLSVPDLWHSVPRSQCPSLPRPIPPDPQF